MSPAWEAAIRADDSAGLASLAAAGGELDQRDRYGQTGIMIAAVHGASRCALWLIAQGAELEHTAKFGLSALMLAAINGRTAIVRALLEGGADPKRRATGAGFAGKTALELARTVGHDEVVEAFRATSG